MLANATADRRVRRLLLDRAEALAHDPVRQGKPLRDALRGYHSVRGAGQRYRVVYRVDEARRLVTVVGIGLRREGDRRDVYAQLLRRLVT